MPRPLLPANEGINLIMKNKTILITGGTTGIGLATAKLLSADGAKIIVTGRNPETLAAIQRELPGVILIKSDSGSLSAAQSLGFMTPPGSERWESIERGHDRLAGRD